MTTVATSIKQSEARNKSIRTATSFSQLFCVVAKIVHVILSKYAVAYIFQLEFFPRMERILAQQNVHGLWHY